MDDNPFQSPPELISAEHLPAPSLLHRLLAMPPGQVPTWLVGDQLHGGDVAGWLFGFCACFAFGVMSANWWTIPVLMWIPYVVAFHLYYPFLKVELDARQIARGESGFDPTVKRTNRCVVRSTCPPG